ncbi:MAG: L-fucose:H+ symporter permease [Pseudomonadota bacterium]
MNSPSSPNLIARGQTLLFVVVASLFFAWGLAANMTDTLLAAFKRIMSMSDFQTTFVQYAFYGAYFCFALPASLLITRFSYKSGILIGLALYIGGALLFYPASSTMQYAHFLIALYVLAAGLSILETSANPFIYQLGPKETATQRLNLAQSFNPIGAISGVVISKFFILANLNAADADARSQMSAEELTAIQRDELVAVMGPYVAVAFILIALWVIIATRRVESSAMKETHVELLPALGRLVRLPSYTGAVFAQFVYVGAQIGIWSFTIRYAMANLDINESAAANYYTAALVAFLLSRFLCTWAMNFVRPTILLSVLSLLAALFTVFAASSSGIFGVYALIAVSACMSLMFPTIYGIGLSRVGADAKIAAAGLVMAIVGGAVITGIQGWVSDLTGSMHMSFYVPAVCFFLITLYSFWAHRTEGMTSGDTEESAPKETFV